MTPSTAIGMLDRALARDGQTVTLERNVSGNTSPMIGDVTAFVRGYRPDELTDDIQQTDRKAILSPTKLPFTPLRLDRLVVAGTRCTIESSDAIMVGSAVVRYELQVRG